MSYFMLNLKLHLDMRARTQHRDNVEECEEVYSSYRKVNAAVHRVLSQERPV